MYVRIYVKAHTSGDIARGTRASHVHKANGHHFFVPVDLVVLQRCKCSSNCNPFLQILFINVRRVLCDI